MKVAISLPDRIYKRTDREARRRKVSRSSVVAEALAAYFTRTDSQAVTERLNEIADVMNREYDAGLRQHAIERLRKAEW